MFASIRNRMVVIVALVGLAIFYLGHLLIPKR